MESDELLQAILSKLDGLEKGQNALQQDVSGMKDDVSSLKGDVSGLKVGQKSLQEQVTKTNITLENDISRKLSALFDGHQLDTEKMDHISETVDAMNDAYAATDIVTRVNSAEINKLKAKIG